MRNLVAFPLLTLAVIFQSAVITHITLLSGYADLPLVLLAAWAIQPHVDSSLPWALLLGVLVAFVSRTPWPVIILGYLSVVLAAQMLRRRVWQVPLVAMFAATLVGTLVMHVLTIVALLFQYGSIAFGDALGLVTMPSLLLNLLFALPAYALMRDLARWVYPDEEFA